MQDTEKEDLIKEISNVIQSLKSMKVKLQKNKNWDMCSKIIDSSVIFEQLLKLLQERTLQIEEERTVLSNVLKLVKECKTFCKKYGQKKPQMLDFLKLDSIMDPDNKTSKFYDIEKELNLYAAIFKISIINECNVKTPETFSGTNNADNIGNGSESVPSPGIIEEINDFITIVNEVFEAGNDSMITSSDFENKARMIMSNGSQLLMLNEEIKENEIELNNIPKEIDDMSPMVKANELSKKRINGGFIPDPIRCLDVNEIDSNLEKLIGEGSFGKASLEQMLIYKGLIIMELAICTLDDLIYSKEKAEPIFKLCGNDLNGDFGPNWKVSILKDVTLALKYAHDFVVIHRDIKPSNILLVRAPEHDKFRIFPIVAKLSDFGLATASSAYGSIASSSSGINHNQFTIGTISYMAPECFDTPPIYSTAGDVYSWGIIANELFSGKKPWNIQGKVGFVAHAEIVVKVFNSERPMPFVADDPIGKQLLELIGNNNNGCLHQDRFHRPTSADLLMNIMSITKTTPENHATESKIPIVTKILLQEMEKQQKLVPTNPSISSNIAKMRSIQRAISLRDPVVCSQHEQKNGSDNSTFQINSIQINQQKMCRNFNGHSDSVYRVIQLQDGRLCSSSYDKSLRIWNLSGTCEQILKDHKYCVTCCVELRNGIICSGSEDKKLKIWDVLTESCIMTLDNNSSIQDLIRLKNGTVCCSSTDDGSVKVWDTTLGSYEKLPFIHRRDVNGLMRIAIIELSDNRLCTFDNIIMTLDNNSSIQDLIRLKNGTVCCSSTDDGSVKVWDTTLGSYEKLPFIHRRDVNGLMRIAIIELSDNRLCTFDNIIRIWKIVDGLFALVPDQTIDNESNCKSCSIIQLADGSLCATCDQGIKIWKYLEGSVNIYDHRNPIFVSLPCQVIAHLSR
eukprot:gene15017-20207_t